MREWGRRLGLEVRPDERRRAVAFALAIGLSQCGFALATSAGDALFLARVGPRHLGSFFALSSAGLIVTLWIVGGAADRRDRRRLLGRTALVGALVMSVLAVLAPIAPRPIAGAVLVASKQFGAALDLLFWVLVAERFDARQARRLVPLFVLAGGAGLAVGSFGVGPLASWRGTEAALIAGAIAFLFAAVAARDLGNPEGILAPETNARSVSDERRGLWDGWRAVRDSRLARSLSLIVAVAGAFAPILYYLLAVGAASALGEETEIAGFLGRYRGIVHIVTLAAQAIIAPALLSRAGVAPTLLLAPMGALAAAIGVAVRPELAMFVVAQASARLLDTAVQTPAERLTHNLLRRHVRGRVAGFVDGIAKRSGAIVGGLTASALIAYPTPLAAATVGLACLWLVLAWRLRRRFPELAVAELAARSHRDDRDNGDSEAVFLSLVDERAVDRLRRDLVGEDAARRDLAVELVDRLGERGRLDPAVELAAAARGGGWAARGGGWAARRRLLGAIGPRRISGGAAADLLVVVDASLVDDPDACAVAVRTLGCIAADIGGELASVVHDRFEPLANGQAPGVVSVAARVAMARLRGEGIDEAIDDALAGSHRGTAVEEMTFELARLSWADPIEPERLLARGNKLLRALRDAGGVTAALDELADALSRVCDLAEPELVLLRQSAQAAAETYYGAPGEAPDERRLAAVRVMAACGISADANILACALTDPDEHIRRAAAAALRDLGTGAVSALLVAAKFGRRTVRNDALEVLRDLRLGPQVLDDLIEIELRDVQEIVARLAPLSALPRAELLLARLEERIGEVAHTLFLTLEARMRSPVIGAAARRFLRARDRAARARALEALDAALPRAFARRVVDIVETGEPAARSARACVHLGRSLLDEHGAVREELHGADPIGRALVVHALGDSGRADHGAAIRDAAAAAVRSLDPVDLMRRLTGDQTSEEEMPRSVEAMMILSQVPLFAELSTRHLAELADVVRWRAVSPGEVVVAEGEVGDSMYFVISGSMRVTVGSTDTEAAVHILGPGEPFGEMALFEGAPRSATVTAVKRTRLGRIDHVEFEELVEDVPGIALAICRVLSRRVRAGNARL